jgi:undecaprenyl-diphosphatase
LALLALAAASWGFVEIADEVLEGETMTFDKWAVKSLRQPDNPELPIGPAWLKEIGRDMTALGGIAVLSLMTTAAAVYLLLLRKWHAMLLMVMAVVSGVLVSTVLKSSFDRPRPEWGSALTATFTSSFPSGHSMLSAVVYLVLGSMLARMESRRALKIYFMVVAVLLTFLVGLSRIYLGAHYPTDVLAGWTAGLAWALLWWLITRFLQHRGRVERADPQVPTQPSA